MSASRIIHVPRRFVAHEWGGTETVILEISKQQKAAGLSPEIHTSLALSTERQEQISGVDVYRYPYCYPFFGLSTDEIASLDKKGGNLISLSLFFRLMVRPGVRLFHAHALKRLGGEVRTAARLRKKPLVVSVHGGVFDVPVAELQTMLKPIENKKEWGKAVGALFGSRRVLEDADQVVCVGQSELDRARGELKHDRLVYLPNGVDTKKFAGGDGAAFRQKHGIPASALLVLNISRIDAQKNQLLLIDAFAEILAKQGNAHLCLIGPVTQKEYADRIRQRVAELGIGDQVSLLPGLRNDNPELVDAYRACDVFVLPSMHEPFGIVVLEAWSAGKPVVASAVGGLQSLIRHGETGLHFPVGSPEAKGVLVEHLSRLVANPADRERLGRAGLQEVQRSYDWSVIGARLEEIYGAAERSCDQRYGRKPR